MGRKRTYSKEELLAKAMDVFREHGFLGTSADMLVERIGVSRYSLYADFGNMQGLFEAALERYNDEIIGMRFGPLELPEAGLSEVQALLQFYGAAGDGPAAGRGCLLCNTAVEFGPNDPTGSQAVQRYFRRLKNAFRNALMNAQKNGDLPAAANPAHEADLLTSVVLGLFVLIRAEAPNETIQQAATAAWERVAALTKQPN